MRIILGSSNDSLFKKIKQNFSYQVLDTEISKFPDGEFNIKIYNERINDNVLIFQSLCPPVHENLIELILLANMAKAKGAKTIKAVVPYLGYSRQDKVTNNSPIANTKIIANLIETTPIDEIITTDIHSTRAANFSYVPLVSLSTENAFLPIVQEIDDLTIVAPDVGGINRARTYSKKLSVEFAIIDKLRVDDKCVVNNILGNVKDKNCFIIDDIVDGASTICLAAETLKKHGAKNIYAAVTHPVLSEKAIEKIDNSLIEKLYVSDSIDINNKNSSKKLSAVSLYDIIKHALL